MTKARKLWTYDSETDPFEYGRVPQPFLWGAYDGNEFKLWWNDTDEFVFWAADQHAIFYGHNGGRFDIMFLLPYLGEDTIAPKIINGRVAEIRIGEAIFRDSWSIIPTKLAAYDKTEIDYTKFEAAQRDQHRDEIIDYLKDDCVYLYELVDTFREEAGKKLTIAGNALAFAKRLGIDMGKTTHYFDSKFRPYYFGGRTSAFITGVHKTGGEIFDINSAYPHAMTYDHPTGRQVTYTDHPDAADFLKIKCHSNEAFPVRQKNYSLHFPNEYGEYHVTKWEYRTAMKLGLISDVEMLEGWVFENVINFEKYIDHWFDKKQEAEKEGDKAVRHVSKIMLNSLYGKCAQNPLNFKDYRFVPVGTETPEGWTLHTTNEDYEIHARSNMDKLEEEYGDEWVNEAIFLNVATAASITGFVRAELMETRERIGRDRAAYCDTDSFIVIGKEPVAGIIQGDKLGQWKTEGKFKEVYIAGKKLNATSPLFDCPKTGDNGSVKKACKGGNLSAKEIKRVCEGEVVTWFNPAPTFSFDKEPNFVSRRFRKTA